MERLLQIWPSYAEIARRLDVPYPTVQAWGHRGVPRKRYGYIINRVKKAGHSVTVADLAGLRDLSVAASATDQPCAPAGEQGV